MADVLAAIREIRRLAPQGRLIVCASCNETVDVIEIDLGAPNRMRPDVCGSCLVAGADPEPAPPEPRS